MVKLKIISLSIFILLSLPGIGQNKDSCTIVFPVIVYYRDNGFHFISNCEIKKFKIEIRDKENNRVFRPGKLKRNKASYFIKFHRYRTGKYTWKIKYTMIQNGQAVVKEIFGGAEFLN